EGLGERGGWIALQRCGATQSNQTPYPSPPKRGRGEFCLALLNGSPKKTAAARPVAPFFLLTLADRRSKRPKPAPFQPRGKVTRSWQYLNRGRQNLSRGRQSQRPATFPRRPQLEQLEDRLALSSAHQVGPNLFVVVDPNQSILMKADPKDHTKLDVF